MSYKKVQLASMFILAIFSSGVFAKSVETSTSQALRLTNVDHSGRFKQAKQKVTLSLSRMTPLVIQIRLATLIE